MGFSLKRSGAAIICIAATVRRRLIGGRQWGEGGKFDRSEVRRESQKGVWCARRILPGKHFTHEYDKVLLIK